MGSCCSHGTSGLLSRHMLLVFANSEQHLSISHLTLFSLTSTKVKVELPGDLSSLSTGLASQAFPHNLVSLVKV